MLVPHMSRPVSASDFFDISLIPAYCGRLNEMTLLVEGACSCLDFVDVRPLLQRFGRALRLYLQYVQVSRISVVGLTYLPKSSLSGAVSRSMHGKYVRITKPHHSAKSLHHTSTVSGVICQKADFRTFLPWSAHSAWHRL